MLSVNKTFVRVHAQRGFVFADIGTVIQIRLAPIVYCPPEKGLDYMKCTYCGGTKFLEGPSGGGSINILCANYQCRHWFNEMGPFGLQDLHCIEPTDEEKIVNRQALKTAKEQSHLALYQSGKDLFTTGNPARSCISEDGTEMSVLRLAGWLDAFRSDIEKHG